MPFHDYDGILTMSIYDFLLNDNSLGVVKRNKDSFEAKK